MPLKIAETIPLCGGFTVARPLGQFSRHRKCLGWFWTEAQARPLMRQLQETTKFQVNGYQEKADETPEVFALA